MKQLLQKIESIKLTNKTTPTFLLFISILVYGLFFWGRGFYWDEFPWMWTYFQFGSEMLTKTFSTSRPFWGMIYQITMPIIGPNPWIWQLLAIFLRWLTAFLLWKILCTLYPNHQKQNLWASLFFLVYPGMGQHFIAFMYSHFYIVLAAFLFSLYLSLLALQSEKYRIPLFIASYFFAFVNLITMEYFYFLEFARLIIFYQFLSRDIKQRLISTVKLFLPYFGIFLGVTIWRAYFFEFQNASYPYVLLDVIREDFFAGILLLINNVLLSFWRTVFQAWLNPFFDIGLTGFGPLTLSLMIILLIVTIVLVGVYLYLRHAERSEASLPQSKRIATEESAQNGYGGLSNVSNNEFTQRAGWLGLISWGLAGGAVWVSGNMPQFNFSMDRFMLPFMLGASILLACMVALIKNQRTQMILVALLIGFAGSRHFQLEDIYRRDWNTQNQLFWQMTERIPNFEKGTILLANDFPVTYYSDNSLTGPLNWIYSPPGEMNLMLYYASFRVGTTLPSVEPDIPHELYYIGPTFYGNTSNILAVYFEPPKCFRVLDPEVEENNRLLPPALRDVAKYTNQNVILFEKAYELPSQFYGTQPEKNWCYYFSQAELARQQKDWQSVVQIAEQAFALGDTPNDPVERFVYIEGFAHVNNWEKAVELSQTSYKVSKNFVGPLLCKLWSRIERETESSTQQSTTVSQVRSEFGCQP
jgi:hypothetical protein